ncbi:MAG: isoprenyl transferase [Clostridiales bacterium]|nr:isoprenyl transferase [Clostridiales bacterium]
MHLFRKKNVAGVDVDLAHLPSHIAIIMDGNGRWATSRGLPRTVGHREGSETFRRVATYLNNIGLKHLTVYAFSTENWSRPVEEVDAIMRLLKEYFLEACEKMVRDNISLKILGDQSALSPELREIIKRTDELSLQTSGLKVNVCINYGGRAEIVNAARILAEKAVLGEIKPEDIDVSLLSEELYTAGIPDPDLIIRPSGELRISNFLLWQSAYAEFYFTDMLWPDFDEKEINRAILSYQKRNRRYGGI